MNIQKKLIDKIAFYIFLFWTFLLIFLTSFLVHSEYEYANRLAFNEAEISVKKDLAYRAWVASHGGVYVPITKETPPNEYLAHVKDRDVNTTSNQHLTLMNPAYTLSQMMEQYSEFYGTKGHITSKIVLNPKNVADDWEKEALEIIETSRNAVSRVTNIEGEPHLRYINPLITDESCLKCHGAQGYKVGDIRGAVSVSIPMKKYRKEAFSFSVIYFSFTFFIWMLGTIAIIYGRKFAKKEIARRVKNYEQNIFSMVSMIEKRDSYTAGHTQRVAKYSILIAKEMGYSQDQEDELYKACMLHDIGKISTPDSILLKPGKLSELEFEIIKEHVVTSYEILKEIDIYQNIAKIVKYHHEKYDGTGYPYGLKGDDIPIGSQIMIVADAFDAMTTNRIYKARKNVKLALQELEDFSGKQFHPKIVKHALIALKDVHIDLNINQIPKTKIEKERFSYFYRDPITELYNIDYLTYVLGYTSEKEFNVACLNSISLHKFSAYNKKYGWQEGDEILKNIARELSYISKKAMIFRIFGDYFIILNEEHFDLQKELYKIESILENTKISFSHKHYDLIKGEVTNISDLEKIIK
ncbi:MAG: HD domain-containing phosphohydrolase [Arcobacteraceae bacterium]